jgi:hypothetical protein
MVACGFSLSPHGYADAFLSAFLGGILGVFLSVFLGAILGAILGAMLWVMLRAMFGVKPPQFLLVVFCVWKHRFSV